jgi:protein O-mannosyl-transferase
MSANRARKKQSPVASLFSGPEQSISLRTTFIFCAALAGAGFLIYGPALNFQFVLDDHRFVGDPRLQNSGHIWEYFTTYVWSQVSGGPASFYRPVFVLWVRLNHILWEASPFGWHLLSVVKHLSVSALLGILAWQLLRDRVAALLASGLFLLHPAHTESVAWVTVPDPLMSIGVLGSLILYLHYADYLAPNKSASESPSRISPKQVRRKIRLNPSPAWLFASVAAYLAALMTKETAIVLPVLIFAIAFTISPVEAGSIRPSGDQGAALRVRLAVAFRQTLPFLSVTVLYLVLRMHALKGQISPLTQHLPWSTVALSWPATLWFYTKVMAWPVQSRAFADPRLASLFSVRSVLLPALAVTGAAALIGLACGWMWRIARRELSPRESTLIEDTLLLGTLLIVLPTLLTLNLNALEPGNYLHGRYTYLPLAGVMLLFSTAWRVAKKARLTLLSAAVLAAIAFSVLTVRQEGMWKDDLTIFTIAHKIAPKNEPVALSLARAQVQVALGLAEKGQCGEALPILDQSILQYPQDWFAWAARGECFFKLNDLKQAEQSFHRAAQLSHEPRVIEQWEQLRARMGLDSVPLD